MRGSPVLLFLAMALAVQPASAETLGQKVDAVKNQILEVLTHVRNIAREVTGNGPVVVVAKELRNQLQGLLDQGMLIKEATSDILTFLQN